MARLGEILRAQRERKGITLEQASEDTRIRQKFLTALEEGDHAALPGAVYTKGFLTNYADYLDLESRELIGLYAVERGATPEQARTFAPMRPIVGRNVLISPTILIPVLVVAAVALFIGYLSWQFTEFATPPRLEVLAPAGDTIVTEPELVVQGRTVVGARVTVRVFPGPETFPDIRPEPDGTFSVPVQLKPGANHIEVQVLDAAGKLSEITRNVRLEPLAQQPTEEPLPQLVVEQPAQGGTYTNSSVPISGRAERAIAELTVNGQAIPVGSDGRFSASIPYSSGTHAVRFVARTAGGAEVTETRTVTVSFTAAVVTVIIQGGDAWLLVRVDGAQAPNTPRVMTSGTSATFTGQQVVLRTGNAGATTVIHNGELLGTLGRAGQVVERTFTFP